MIIYFDETNCVETVHQINNTSKMILNICNENEDVFINQYEEFCDIINGSKNIEDIFDKMSFCYDSIKNYNRQYKYELINTGDSLFSSDLEDYSNLLSTTINTIN